MGSICTIKSFPRDFDVFQAFHVVISLMCIAIRELRYVNSNPYVAQKVCFSVSVVFYYQKCACYFIRCMCHQKVACYFVIRILYHKKYGVVCFTRNRLSVVFFQVNFVHRECVFCITKMCNFINCILYHKMCVCYVEMFCFPKKYAFLLVTFSSVFCNKFACCFIRCILYCKILQWVLFLYSKKQTVMATISLTVFYTHFAL